MHGTCRSRWRLLVASALFFGPVMNDDNEPTLPAPPSHRPVRTFVLRAGRMGPGQTRALATLGARYVVPFSSTAAPGIASQLDLPGVFGRTAPVVVEIGFGMGQATADFASSHPDLDVLGLEVHPPGVGSLLQMLQSAGLGNVRIIQHDAVEVFRSGIAPGSLSGIHCFFPDPWPKTRHHKRRLIQPPFVNLLAQRLVAGGYVHLATDWQPYAEQMLQVMNGEPLLVNTSKEGYTQRPASRTLTKFERRGLNLGHGVWDLIYTRHS